MPHESSLQELQALHARAIGDVLTLRLVRLKKERIGNNQLSLLWHALSLNNATDHI